MTTAQLMDGAGLAARITARTSERAAEITRRAAGRQLGVS